MDFERFHNQDFIDRNYELYVLKNGSGNVLYLGITQRSIWERWFGWSGHMVWDRKVIYGNSPVGQKIEHHLPDSLKWKIQLWTLKDSIRFCREQLAKGMLIRTIGDIEPIMIQKLSPILNGTYNLKPGKDTTPKSEKEKKLEQTADEVYKKVFDSLS